MNRALSAPLLLAIALVAGGLVVAVGATTVAGGGAAVKPLAGCADNSLGATDDGGAGPVPLPFTLDLFSVNYDALYVNNNGNVTFDSPLLSFTAVELSSLGRVIIAPFFADVDTEGAGSGVVTYGDATFDGHAAFCVDWIDVGYYNNATDKLNSFQLLLVDRSDIAAGDFDIVMNYDQIEWETGVAGGLGGASARAGYSTGKVSFELPGSGVPGAFLDSNPAGLVHDSQDSPIEGRYVFAVRSGLPPTPVPTVTPTPAATATPTSPAAPTATNTPVSPPVAFGDANCDTRVNAIDAAFVLQFAAGLISSLPCQHVADVNEDGSINAIDSALLLQFSAGLISSLPV